MKAEFRVCLKHNRIEEMIYSGVIPNLEKKNHFQSGNSGFERRCNKVIGKHPCHDREGDLSDPDSRYRYG